MGFHWCTQTYAANGLMGEEKLVVVVTFWLRRRGKKKEVGIGVGERGKKKEVGIGVGKSGKKKEVGIGASDVLID